MTALERVTDRDRAQIGEFFRRLSTPIDPEKTHAREQGEVFSPFYIIGWVTGGAGLLLLAAAAAQGGGVGLAVNACSGAVLCLLGLGFNRLHRRFMRKEAASGRSAPAGPLAPEEAPAGGAR